MLKIDFYRCRHMIDHESAHAVVLMSSRKPPCNSSATATGLESIAVDECKEKISMEGPQNKTVA